MNPRIYHVVHVVVMLSIGYYNFASGLVIASMGIKKRRASSLPLGRVDTEKEGDQISRIVSTRQIISFIESTCEPYLQSDCFDNVTTTTDNRRYWKKMRAYIYRAATLTKTPLTMTQVESVVFYLVQTFGNKSPSVICEVLSNYPRILRKSAKHKLEPTIQLLQKLYGDLFYEAIEKNPSLLFVTGVGFEAPQSKIRRNGLLGQEQDMSVETYLLNTVAMSKTQVEKLKVNHPKIFQLSTSSNVKPVIDFLYTLCRDKSHKTVQRVLVSNPNILGLDVASNLQPKIYFLQERCGIANEDIELVLNKSPGILGYSLSEKYEPTIQFLECILRSTKADAIDRVQQQKLLSDLSNQQTMNFTLKPMLRQCLLRHPQLLSLSLENLRTKTLYFDAIDYLSTFCKGGSGKGHQDNSQKIVLNEPSLVSQIASTMPSVLSLSLYQNIIPTVSTLANTWGASEVTRIAHDFIMGIQNISQIKRIDSSVDVSQMLGEYPGVLTLALQGNIQPTLTFFNQTKYIHIDAKGHGTNSKLRPRYIATSLVNCLLPRWNYYISTVRPNINDSERPPIHILAGSSDAKFCEKLGFDLDDYTQYKDLSLPAFKFKSQFDTWLKTGRPIDAF